MITATLVGNVCADPEEKETQSGDTYVKFSIACRRNKDETDFVKCTAFGASAKTISEHVRKGHQLVVYGRLSLNKWNDKEGYERFDLQAQVSSISLLRNNANEVDDDGEPKSKPKRRKAAATKQQQETEGEFDPYAAS